MILPPALEALEGRLSNGTPYARSPTMPSTFADVASVAGSKRSRGIENVFNAQPSKAAKTNKVSSRSEFATTRDESPDVAGGAHTTSGVARLVDEFMQKHPVAGEVRAEDEELFCTCLQPANDRPMIACANGESCRLQLYHIECLGLTEEELRGSDSKFSCIRLVWNFLTFV